MCVCDSHGALLEPVCFRNADTKAARTREWGTMERQAQGGKRESTPQDPSLWVLLWEEFQWPKSPVQPPLPTASKVTWSITRLPARARHPDKLQLNKRCPCPLQVSPFTPYFQVTVSFISSLIYDPPSLSLNASISISSPFPDSGVPAISFPSSFYFFCCFFSP